MSLKHHHFIIGNRFTSHRSLVSLSKSDRIESKIEALLF